VKSVLFLIVLVAAVALFFHDKQQTADLDKAQADNAQLTQQLSDKDATISGLQSKIQQMTAQSASAAVAARRAVTPGTEQSANPSSGSWGWQGSGSPLDRPAYKGQ